MKRLIAAMVVVGLMAGSAFAARLLPRDDNTYGVVQAPNYDATKTVTFYVTKSYTYTFPTAFKYLGYHFQSEATDCEVEWNADGKSWDESEGVYIKNDSMTSIKFTNTSTAAPGKKVTMRFW
jgi:hypothetical protein